MKLFAIQDSDRPMWVVAADWQDALNKWKTKIREENEGECDEPEGISLICDEDDLLETAMPMGLTWGENPNRQQGQIHTEWHVPCGCAFHPLPFPHIHPCSNEHKRPDLHDALTEDGVLL